MSIFSKSVSSVIIALILCTCIDPYVPNIVGYDSNLVVDGLITNANRSYIIKLTRTFYDNNTEAPTVSNAIVFISDNLGIKHYLVQTSGGIYKTDSLEFIGTIGHKYVLNILTPNGEEYRSDSCLMLPVPDIDSLYFDKDIKYVNNNSQSQEGISIYLDSKKGDRETFYRWEFEETWKFKAPYPPEFTFINSNKIVPYSGVQKLYCWKNDKSNGIIIGSSISGQVTKQPIAFIASDQSDRLTIEYSILIKQYSISNDEYKFLSSLNKVNEAGSTIFATEPYLVESNIHNIKHPDEKIQGYFGVSAVSQKRIFISLNDVVKYQLPNYRTPCNPVEADLFYEPRGFDVMYSVFCVSSDWIFIKPIYSQGILHQLVFVRPECANCEITGSQKEPDFWIDKKIELE